MSAMLRAVLLGLALSAAAPVFAQAETATLQLSADGTVSAAPDTAVVTLGVVEQAATAGEALTANNASMRATLEALTGAGIAGKDIGTSQFSIEPVMVYPDNRTYDAGTPPKIVGYRVSNEVTVKIRDLAKAGDLLDKVIRVGANNVRGIAFTVADSTRLMDEARKAAMKAVRAKAELYAEAGGFRLTRIVSLSENAGPVFERAPMKAMAMAPAPNDSVPISAGEQDMSVTVNVTWEISDTAP